MTSALPSTDNKNNNKNGNGVRTKSTLSLPTGDRGQFKSPKRSSSPVRHCSLSGLDHLESNNIKSNTGNNNNSYRTPPLTPRTPRSQVVQKLHSMRYQEFIRNSSNCNSNSNSNSNISGNNNNGQEDIPPAFRASFTLQNSSSSFSSLRKSLSNDESESKTFQQSAEKKEKNDTNKNDNGNEGEGEGESESENGSDRDSKQAPSAAPLPTPEAATLTLTREPSLKVNASRLSTQPSDSTTMRSPRSAASECKWAFSEASTDKEFQKQNKSLSSLATPKTPKPTLLSEAAIIDSTKTPTASNVLIHPMSSRTAPPPSIDNTPPVMPRRTVDRDCFISPPLTKDVAPRPPPPPPRSVDNRLHAPDDDVSLLSSSSHHRPMLEILIVSHHKKQQLRNVVAREVAKKAHTRQTNRDTMRQAALQAQARNTNRSRHRALQGALHREAQDRNSSRSALRAASAAQASLQNNNDSNDHQVTTYDRLTRQPTSNFCPIKSNNDNNNIDPFSVSTSLSGSYDFDDDCTSVSSLGSGSFYLSSTHTRKSRKSSSKEPPAFKARKSTQTLPNAPVLTTTTRIRSSSPFFDGSSRDTPVVPPSRKVFKTTAAKTKHTNSTKVTTSTTKTAPRQNEVFAMPAPILGDSSYGASRFSAEPSKTVTTSSGHSSPKSSSIVVRQMIANRAMESQERRWESLIDAAQQAK